MNANLSTQLEICKRIQLLKAHLDESYIPYFISAIRLNPRTYAEIASDYLPITTDIKQEIIGIPITLDVSMQRYDIEFIIREKVKQ